MQSLRQGNNISIPCTYHFAYTRLRGVSLKMIVRGLPGPEGHPPALEYAASVSTGQGLQLEKELEALRTHESWWDENWECDAQV